MVYSKGFDSLATIQHMKRKICYSRDQCMVLRWYWSISLL